MGFKNRLGHTKQINFSVDDQVMVILVSELYSTQRNQKLSYTGIVTKIEENGLWVVLDEDKTKEEYFSFSELENVVSLN